MPFGPTEPAERLKEATRKLLEKRKLFRRRRFFPLPWPLRIGLFLAGWGLVLVGIVGLVLPGIQGVLTLVVGAALLSLASELAYEKLHGLLHRWPGAWRRIDGLRLKLLRRLRRRRSSLF